MDHAISIIKLFLKDLPQSAICVDATLGNGHDFIYLMDQVAPLGFVYGIDIQPISIMRLSEILSAKYAPERYTLILDNHANVKKHITHPHIDYVCFNLGYLPGGEKFITTNALDVQKSLQDLLPLLSPEGFISLVFYPGHVLGRIEKNMLFEYLKHLNQSQYSVIKINFENQKNNPPMLVIIKKNAKNKE